MGVLRRAWHDDRCGVPYLVPVARVSLQVQVGDLAATCRPCIDRDMKKGPVLKPGLGQKVT